jgi:hypothetical protein
MLLQCRETYVTSAGVPQVPMMALLAKDINHSGPLAQPEE